MRSLMAGFSIEITPREAQRIHCFADHLPKGTRVYLPFVNRIPFIDTVRAAGKLRRHGMVPVAHIAARAIREEAHLHEMLCRVRGEAGMDEVLVVGGDLSVPMGPFHCAMQVVETGLLERHGISRIGFGGHPEPHPDIDRAVLEGAAREKAAYAQRSTASCHWLTQLCFSPARILEWVRHSRDFAQRLPVHAGVHGFVSTRTLLHYASICGVGPSMRTLARDRRKWLLPWQPHSPGAFLSQLAEARHAAPQCVPDRIHLFSLGAFVRTAAWAREVLDGVACGEGMAAAPPAFRDVAVPAPHARGSLVK
jgi:methylenetetrahydrofolate reductase (NADPH)